MTSDEAISPGERLAAQLRRFRRGVAKVLATNRFYAPKLAGLAAADIRTLDDFRRIPFTTKADLTRDQLEHPPFGTNLTYPLERYVRVHQTSGTTGTPLRVLDTEDSWRWWAHLWAYVYRAAGVTPADRVYFCFGFGPFIGFWSAFEGARAIGALAISGGGQTTVERLRGIVDLGATVVLSTPTYALRLAEVAREHAIGLSRSDVRVTIHAGEPGASIPQTRARIEEAFGARAFDHTGASEVGATGFSCAARDSVHLIESEFIAEVVEPLTGRPVPAGGDGELVLTNLGRWGQPAIRYRTGDRVRPAWDTCSCGRTFMRMVGGILGRVDDMITVRGVNVFPSAIEGIVRRFPDVAEFQLELRTERGMDELSVRVEVVGGGAAEELCRRIADRIHVDLSLRCRVEAVAPGSLPRFELKAQRLVRVG